MDDTRAADAGMTASPNGHHHPDGPRDDELDALADLFLGPASHPGTPAPAHHQREDRGPRPAERRTTLEAVILGHLPISASAWPGQYARRRAEQTGEPVAVVRLARGSLTIDVIGAGNPDDPPANHLEALSLVRRVARVVILRVEEQSEPALAGAPGIHRLCLLTGADDAAVVACYRKLKALAAGAHGPLPEAHLTVMGADERRGRLAHERVARAAREFLHADLFEPVVIDRIGPTGSIAVFRGPCELPLEEVARLLAGEGPAQTRPARPTTAPEPDPLPPPPAPARLAEPQAHDATAPTTGPDGEALCDLIAGVSRIESRCPFATRLELGADGPGRLHIVAGVLTGHPALSTTDAVGELLRAAAWARTNSALLTKAEPRVRSTDAALHLVTDDARAAARLAGSIVRVHLAVPARPMAFGLTTVALDA